MVILMSNQFVSMKIDIKLSKFQAEEIQHKLGVLMDTDDLLNDYNVTKEEIQAVYDSLPRNGRKKGDLGGVWIYEADSRIITAVTGEMADHAVVLRDMAKDCLRNRDANAARRNREVAQFFEFHFCIPPEPAFNRGTPCEKSPRKRHLMEEVNVRREGRSGVMDLVCKYCGGTQRNIKFADLY